MTVLVLYISCARFSGVPSAPSNLWCMHIAQSSLNFFHCNTELCTGVLELWKIHSRRKQVFIIKKVLTSGQFDAKPTTSMDYVTV